MTTLTPAEQAAAAALEEHEVYFFDMIGGLACDCGEDLSMGSTAADARQHQAKAIVAAVRPIIAAEFEQEGTPS